MARRQRAAASAVLLDRRCDAAEAVPHLVLGWLSLARHLRPDVELETLGEALSDLALEGLTGTQRRAVRETVPALVEAFSAQLDGSRLQLPARKALSRQAFLLSRAVGAQRQRTRTRLPRRLRMVTGGLVFLSAVAAILSMTMTTRTGWRGSYFANRDLRPPARQRQDPRVQFNWGASAPMAGMPKDHFAVRWETCLSLSSARSLHIMVGSNDGARVELDGKTIINNWKLQYFTWRSHKARVPAGTHRLRVEYFESTGDARVEVKVRDLEARAPLAQKHFKLPRKGGGEGVCEGR